MKAKRVVIAITVTVAVISAVVGIEHYFQIDSDIVFIPNALIGVLCGVYLAHETVA